MNHTPSRDELLAKVASIAASGGVKVCPDCNETGKIVTENEDGKVSWRTCECRWETT